MPSNTLPFRINGSASPHFQVQSMMRTRKKRIAAPLSICSDVQKHAEKYVLFSPHVFILYCCPQYDSLTFLSPSRFSIFSSFFVLSVIPRGAIVVPSCRCFRDKGLLYAAFFFLAVTTHSTAPSTVNAPNTPAAMRSAICQVGVTAMTVALPMFMALERVTE